MEHDRATGKLVVRVRHQNKSDATWRRKGREDASRDQDAELVPIVKDLLRK
jgi:hypothetical protein